MKKEIFSVRNVISPEQLLRDGSSYERYTHEHMIRELGLAYAEKYATMEIHYLYQNMREDGFDRFKEKQDISEKPYLRFVGKEITYRLGEE